MATASDAQVQKFVDTRIRPRSEQIRALYLSIKDDTAAIGDIYEALTQPSPTWKDNRTDGPPHLMTPSDVLAINTAYDRFIKLVEGTLQAGEVGDFHGQYPVILDACVRPSQG